MTISDLTPTLPADVRIDATYGFCDPPLLELIRWMHLLPVGAVLAVDGRDASEGEAIRQWLRMVDYEFLGEIPGDGYTHFVARKTH